MLSQNWEGKNLSFLKMLVFQKQQQTINRQVFICIFKANNSRHFGVM